MFKLFSSLDFTRFMYRQKKFCNNFLFLNSDFLAGWKLQISKHVTVRKLFRRNEAIIDASIMMKFDQLVTHFNKKYTGPTIRLILTQNDEIQKAIDNGAS